MDGYLSDIDSTSKYLICIAVIVIVVYLITGRAKYKMVKYRSDIDDHMYVVRDTPDKQKASNMLARIKKNIFLIANNLSKNKGKTPTMVPYIDQLNKNIQSMSISETDGSSQYTSYSVNKGEEMVFCLRSKNPVKFDTIHDMNLVMYVALHEMAHVGCPEYGHTELFNDIFTFLAQTAVSMGLYQQVNYTLNPHEYCGLLITTSVI